MSRFSQPQDPVFRQLNASIGFDYRLAPYDVEQSRAHARMLAARDIISEGDRDVLVVAVGAMAGTAVDRGQQPADWPAVEVL